MITHARKIDMYPASVPVVVHLSQYDDDFTLEFTMFSSVGEFTVETGTTAKIRGTKKDGKGYSANATINTTQKKVTVTGNQQMTAIAGRNVYELVLTRNNKVLSTANFILDVEPAAMDANTVESESVIQEIGETVNAYLDEHPEMIYQVDDTLSITGAAADAKKTGDQIADLKEDLNYHTEEAIAVAASPEGWRLTGNGTCTEATAYKLVKYEVTAGDMLHLVLSKDVTGSETEGVYQWQNAVGVSSNLPNSALIGTPVAEAVDGYVTVPEGATYLIVSQFKTNTTNSVKLVTGTTTMKEKIAAIETDVDELEAKVDGIEPGLSSEAKAALLACIEHVKWSDDNGQSYYDDLYNALYGVQPDPEVPNAYTRYDWIRLKQYSEASNVYTEGGANYINVGINDGFNPMIATSAYSDLNQLNFKATIGIMAPPASLSGSPNSCAFGGGLSDDATARMGTYWHTSKQWIYCMMHGVERQIQQELQDVNTLEIINNSSSPSTVKINGTAHSFVWTNSNVLNNRIAYFMNKNFSSNPVVNYFSGAGTYTKVGEIEISTQGGELISKLIPVMRKADNVIGIWDSVRKEFYTPTLSKYATIGDASCIYAVGNWEQ